ncbi:MAG: hypothetical protein J7L04_04690, partial [Bacteroidales bacterium]|nr:hypothetical protein [Bacteroidales bacterium]
LLNIKLNFIMKKNIIQFSGKIPWLTAILFTLITYPISAQKKSEITTGKLKNEYFQKYQTLRDSSSFKDLHWQFLGPTNTSGRCTDVAVVSPKGKNFTMYVATASGGVWKTKNEGTSWEPIFDQQASTSIGDIALDPNNQEVIWVGTGESNIFRSSQAGSGILKSIDGGKSWKTTGLENTSSIARIIVDPTNSNTVFVAASGHEWTKKKERGVYKTNNGGESWKKVLYIDDLTGAIDLAMDPEDSQTLYAATWQRVRGKWNDPRIEPGYSKSGIYKTTDGGKSWNPINNGLPQSKYRGRIGIDVSASNPNVVYAFVDNYEFSHEFNSEETDSYGRPKTGVIKGATIYRSKNKGENWEQVSGLTDDTKTYMERHSSTYGWVFGQIRVDPNDENTIYTMGLGLNVSIDGGKSFKRLRGMHGDHHGLWIDPDNSNYLVNANDGGIYISYDKGKNWRSFTDRLPLVQFFNIGYDMDEPFNVYGSIQDHGSRKGTVDLRRGRDRIQSVDFSWAPGGEGSTHVIDPTNPNMVYSAGFYGSITRTDMSKPRRQGSKRIKPEVFEAEAPLRGQWIAPFILSPHNPDIIYLGMQYIFRSLDKGSTWERISPDLSYNDPGKLGDIPYQTIFAISESPLMYGLIYAGTDDGRAHITKDGGKNWTEISKGLAKDRWVSRIVASKYKQSTVYLTQNGKRDDNYTPYVWKSTDYGQTWLDISSNIPLGPVNVIREDPVNKNILYAGSDVGVYVTKDGGKSWDVLGDLPSTYVHDLIIHPRDNVIVIATHGRGMWVLDANKINGGLMRRKF